MITDKPKFGQHNNIRGRGAWKAAPVIDRNGKKYIWITNFDPESGTKDSKKYNRTMLVDEPHASTGSFTVERLIKMGLRGAYKEIKEDEKSD